MSESSIHIGKSGAVSYSGPDAVAYFRARSLRSALQLYFKTNGQIIPTRGMGITNMLRAAGEITNTKYKRTQAAMAIDDLTIWIATMQSALPITSDE
jgi:hypothetical protein